MVGLSQPLVLLTRARRPLAQSGDHQGEAGAGRSRRLGLWPDREPARRVGAGRPATRGLRAECGPADRPRGEKT